MSDLHQLMSNHIKKQEAKLLLFFLSAILWRFVKVLGDKYEATHSSRILINLEKGDLEKGDKA